MPDVRKNQLTSRQGNKLTRECEKTKKDCPPEADFATTKTNCSTSSPRRPFGDFAMTDYVS